MQREPRDESRPAPARQDAETDKKRRFKIVKLEERIAPGGGHGKGSNGYFCGHSKNCYHKTY